MFKKILLAAIIALPMSALAQKFGVVNAESILQAMPETAQMQTTLTDASKKYEDEFAKLQQEFQNKYEQYQKDSKDASLLESIKERRLSELQELNTKIEQFRATAAQDLQKKQAELLQPIQEKILNAIKSVGQKNSYTFIFQNEAPVYVGTDVVDVTPLVKSELGVK